MLFNSLAFIAVFLPLSFFCYFLTAPRRARLGRILLVLASLVFYTAVSISTLWLVLSVVVNLLTGFLIFHVRDRARLLYRAGVVFNILLLLSVRHFPLVADAADFFFFTDWSTGEFIAPLGLSFITLQQIRFLHECRQGHLQLELSDYLLFILFFPKVLAGPVVSYEAFRKQVAEASRKIEMVNVASGMVLFTTGLLKKNLLADLFWPVAQKAFAAGSLNIVQAWVGALCNLLYVYFDMSAWMDMALGAALLFNIVLPPSFSRPFAAISPLQFWERWNITITRFFQDLVYRPLLARKLPGGSVLPVLSAFVLMGLWYSPRESLLVWALMNAAGILAVKLAKHWSVSVPSWLGWLLTMGLVLVSFLFFTAGSVEEAMVVLKGMASLKSLLVYYNEWYILWALGANYITALLIAASVGVLAFYPSRSSPENRFSAARAFLYACLSAIALLTLNGSGFLYLTI
jgi:alginate O-acetyltransferase complex protein AlgI